MESFLPTEIARLVYGYLIEENCTSAAQLFLESSLHLKECLMVTKKGRRFNTCVSGHNLVDILDKLCEVTCIVKAHIDQKLTEVTPESDLLTQLKTLLIPNEDKKVKRCKLLKNSEMLLDKVTRNDFFFMNHGCSVPDLFQPTEQALQESKEQSILNASLSNPAYRTQEDFDPCQEKLNNDIQIEHISGSPVSLTKDSEGYQDAIHVLKTFEIKKNVSNNQTQAKESSNKPVDTDNYASKSHPVQLDIQENICAEETKIGNKDIDGKNVKIDSEKSDDTEIASRSGGASENIVNCTSLPISPSPVTVKQICNESQPALTSFTVQVNASPKFQLSLLNYQTSAEESECLNNFQKPLTAAYSLMQPFIRSPTTIYIKPPLKNPLIKNIFTSEHLPEISTERLVLIKPMPPASKINDIDSTQFLDEAVLSQETNQRKIDKKLSDTPLIKRSGVRTRGGYVKRGGKSQRRVKAHVPNKALLEDKIHLSIESKQNNNEQSEIFPSNIPDAEIENSVLPLVKEELKKAVIQESPLVESSFNVDVSSTTTEQKQSDTNQKLTDITSERTGDTSRNLRKRISLSVPRRGSHVRNLDFKTPTKSSISNRRAITSPKQIHASRSPNIKKSLRSVKGALFKSPSIKKESKAWDADLRKYTSESTDVPTSVGLQRKNSIQAGNHKPIEQKSSGNCFRKKSGSNNIVSPLTTRTTLVRNEESNEDLAEKIQKEVLSVIGEEDITLIGESKNSMCDSRKDNSLFQNDNLGSTSPNKNKENTSAMSSIYPNSEEILNTPLKISAEHNCQNVESLLNIIESEGNRISPDPSSLMTPVSKAIQEHREILEKGLLTPGTPQSVENICITIPSKDRKSLNTELPQMKIISPGLNLTCQDSLEASLIKECTRIEKENIVNSIGNEAKDNSTTENIFGTSQKSMKCCNYDGNLDVTMMNNFPDQSPSISSCTNQEPKIDKKMKLKNLSNKYDSDLNISETLITQNFIPTHQLHEEHIVKNTNLCKLSVPIISLNCNSGEGNAQKENEIINSNNHSSKQSDENKCNSEDVTGVNVSIVDEIDHLNKDNRAQRNNSSTATPLGGKTSRPQEECEKLNKTSKIGSGELKTKSRKCTKNYEIDCGKLIARCLQSAKENLFGTEKKLTSLSEGSTSVTKNEYQIKTSKAKHLLNNVSHKKNSHSLNIKLTSDRTLHSRIKNINDLLFEDTKSSSSEDSDILEARSEMYRNNEVGNYEQERTIPKVKMNNQISSPSTEKIVSISDENHVAEVDRYITRRKKKLLQDSLSQVIPNKLENVIPQEQNSFRGQKDNLMNCLSKNLPNKTSATISKNISVMDNNISISMERLQEEDNVKDGQNSATIIPKNCTVDVERIKEKTIINESLKINEKVEKVSNKSQKSLTPRNSVSSKSDQQCEAITLKTDTSTIQKPISEEQPNFSEKLNNYVYSFTLTLDGRNVTKELRVSPFYNIFELESKSENSMDCSKKINVRNCHTSPISQQKFRKRKSENDEEMSDGSANNSFGEDRKFTPNKKYKRECDFTYKEPFCSRSERHRNYRLDDKRINKSPRVREKDYGRENIKENYGRETVKENYGRKYRDEYTFPRFRRFTSRYWTRGRIGVSHHRNTESSRSSYRNKESGRSETSHRHHKDISDTKKHEGTKKSNELSFRNQYLGESAKSRSTSSFSVRPLKEKKEQKVKFDKEDGELSESSRSAYSFMPAAKNAQNICQRAITAICDAPPIDEETRAKLKKINLDQFLSMLHGTEK